MPTSRRISNFAENQRWGLFFDQINDSREIFSLDRYSGGNNKYQARISQYSYLRAAKNTGNFCRTDSFRLAEQRTNIQTKPFNLLLPQKTAVEVMRIFQDLEEDVAVRFNKNQISFSSKYLCLISRLIDGKFPDYQGIIPKQFSTQAVLDKNSILGSLKAASVFSSKLSDVVIKVEPKDNIIEIKASSSETGEHKSQISSKISGDAIQATFNFRYLIDAVSHLRDDKIFLGFNGPDRKS